MKWRSDLELCQHLHSLSRGPRGNDGNYGVWRKGSYGLRRKDSHEAIADDNEAVDSGT